MPLTWPSAGFQSLSPLPTSKLGPSCADYRVNGFVYILGPCGSLQWTLLWGLEILPLLQSPQIFITRDFDALFPHAGTLACGVCLAPQLFLPGCLHVNVGLPGPPAAALLLVLSTCLPLPLPPVWMNVSPLTPWLSDFHTVRFSSSSCYILFLNLLLPFYWLWKGRQSICIYTSLLAGSWFSSFSRT